VSSVASKSAIKLYYPLLLDIAQSPCIVIGGGRVAERKVTVLLRFNGKVRVISPDITAKIARLQKENRIEVVKRAYKEGDLKGAVLCFAATNDRETNQRITEDAHKTGVPVNVVDDPQLCSFIVPAIIKRGPIIVAVSTLGHSPSLSKRLAEEINRYIIRGFIEYARIMGRFRRLLIKDVKEKKRRKEIMDEIERMGMDAVNEIKTRGLIKRFLKT
jgi:siroheme synthase-like protein